VTSQGAWKYRGARFLGRLVTRTAATLTLGHMPPFVSTSALVMEGDRILVVIDPIRDEPIIPGGHMKWEESPQETVVREIREETGLDISVRRLVEVYSGAEWAGERGIVRIIYEGAVVGGSLVSSAEGEARWWSGRELANSSTRDAAIVREWLARQPASVTSQ